MILKYNTYNGARRDGTASENASTGNARWKREKIQTGKKSRNTDDGEGKFLIPFVPAAVAGCSGVCVKKHKAFLTNAVRPHVLSLFPFLFFLFAEIAVLAIDSAEHE